MNKIAKKGVFILSLVAMFTLVFNNVFAEITISDLLDDGTQKTSMIQTIAGQGLSMLILQPIVTAITALIKFFLAVVVAVLGLVFSVSGIAIGLGESYFPLPHHMVFNLIPMLDPNFINPYRLGANSGTFTITEMISTVISPMYFTMISLATTVFVIIALFIGIKLAISVSANEKAQYKSAIMSWITGLVLLFTGHFIMSGIFYVNEQIVSNLYASSEDMIAIDITVPKDMETAEKIGRFFLTTSTTIAASVMLGPFIGAVSSSGLLSEFSRSAYTTETRYGFDGVMTYYYQDMIYNNNPISTLIIAVMLGQIVALLILYIKRLIYVVILGLLYPFVIIVDTYKKVTGQKGGGLFEKWLQQFTITVFMQSIHAVLLFFIILITNKIFENTKLALGIDKIDLFEEQGGIYSQQNQLLTIVMIIQMGAIASLTRLENVIKEYIGVPDAKAGSLRGSGMLGYSAFRMGSSAIKNVADNFTGARNNRAKVVNLRNKLNKAKAADGKTQERMQDETINNTQPRVIPPNTKASANSYQSTVPTVAPLADGRPGLDDINEINKMTGTDNPSLVRIQNSIEKLINTIEKQGTSTVNALNGEGTSSNRLRTANDVSQGGDANKELLTAIKGINKSSDSVDGIEAELRQAERDLAAKSIAKVASFGFVPGSLALGLGMTSSMDDTAKVASAIISLGDKVSEAVGRNIPAAAQKTVIQHEVNYEQFLQQKIASSYTQDKYERSPASSSKTSGEHVDIRDI